MTTYHIAQVNIGQIKAPLEDQVMSGFVFRLDEINALADSSPGFVWRLQSPAGNATYLRPYENDRILLNMSVWETIDALKDYVTAPLTRSFCANGTIGLKNSRACTPLCGGFRSDTFPVLTRRRNALPIWTSMDQRSLHSLSRRFSSPMMNSRKASIVLLPDERSAFVNCAFLQLGQRASSNQSPRSAPGTDNDPVRRRTRTGARRPRATEVPPNNDRLPQFGLDGHGQENAEQSGDSVGTLVLIAPLGALESLTFRRLRGRNARACLIVGISHECP